METYRIVRVTFVVGESWKTVERFAVQRRTRLMWIGPYIWETYTAEYNFEDSWSYFIGNGEFYDTLEDANKVIEKLKIRHENWKISSVTAEHNYDEAENKVSCVKDGSEDNEGEKLYELRYATASGKPVNIKDSDALNSLKSMGFVSNIAEDGICVMRFNKPITTIGNSLFCNSDLASIDIPDSVISIKEDAFVCCRSLTSITIPDSVTSIDKYAFYCCSNLTNITIGNGVTSIGDWTFAWCKNLTSITIPNNVMCIGNYAFSWCDNLTEIHYSGTATGFPWSAIKATLITDGNDNKDTANDNDAVNDNDDTVNEKLYELRYATASGKPFNTKYKDALISLETMGFVSNTVENGTCIMRFNKPITTIGNSLFYDSDLTSIDIPDSVTSIEDYAFTWCKLTSIVIPDSVTSIGDDVFKSCSSLTSITIGNGVTSIGKEAFYDCTGLTSIVIPDSVTSIEYGTFNLCSSLESIVIPNGVTSIGDYAFYDCTGLTSIVISDSVTNIGVRSFAWCKNLTSITIPDSVTSIGYETFYGCSGLTSITIPNSVTRIEYWTFEECNNLAEIHYSGPATGFPWGANNATLIQ